MGVTFSEPVCSLKASPRVRTLQKMSRVLLHGKDTQTHVHADTRSPVRTTFLHLFQGLESCPLVPFVGAVMEQEGFR